MFPFPDTNQWYHIQPTRYISHLIGHEGEGSILSYFKKNGKDFDFFLIIIFYLLRTRPSFLFYFTFFFSLRLVNSF